MSTTNFLLRNILLNFCKFYTIINLHVIQCGSRSKYLSCVAPGASDVVIGPVLFNFISHIVAASARSADYKTPDALERLKNAYLFDDDAMDEKEYLTTRSDLQERLTRLNNQIADERTSDLAAAPELSFINSASAFLLSYRVQSGEHIVYSDLAAAVEPKVLQKFIRQIVDHIEIKSSRVSGITFKNGLDCKFIFK